MGHSWTIPILSIMIVTTFVLGFSAQDAYAASQEIIVNGDFETGTFVGWTVTNTGSGTWNINDGTFFTPFTGINNLPISGSFDAVTTQFGPSTHILSEPFTVPSNIVSAQISWKDRIFNLFTAFSDPTQEVRVQLVNSAGTTVLAEIFSTNPGDPLIQVGPNTRSFDITTLLRSLEGQSIRFNIVQEVNLNFFHYYVDDISILVTDNSGGGGPDEPPTIGMNYAGTKLIVPCGVNFDGKCFTITAPYHEEFKLYEMMSGTHTISITMYCSNGVTTCSYAAIGIMPYSESMANTTWKIELYKDFEGNLTTVTTDPEGFLGTVTATTQILDDKFWVVSFTIEFKNKDTGPMKFGVQARDGYNAVRNWELNEGVEIIDSDAYPSILTEFKKSLEVDSLCLNEDPTYRYSCAFAKIRERATKIAEETLWQMLNN